jgi:hypothetical protein
MVRLFLLDLGRECNQKIFPGMVAAEELGVVAHEVWRGSRP